MVVSEQRKPTQHHRHRYSFRKFLHRFSLAARGISKRVLVFCPRLRPSSKRNVSRSLLGIPMQSGSWRRADGFACWWRCPIFQTFSGDADTVLRCPFCPIAGGTVRFCPFFLERRFCPILSDSVRFCPILSDSVRFQLPILSDSVRFGFVGAHHCACLVRGISFTSNRQGAKAQLVSMKRCAHPLMASVYAA